MPLMRSINEILIFASWILEIREVEVGTRDARASFETETVKERMDEFMNGLNAGNRVLCYQLWARDILDDVTNEGNHMLREFHVGAFRYEFLKFAEYRRVKSAF
ncbi:MAG: hypothetical protein MMC33_000423 [Icmadophila ericetorum]|nr:hypothetical protein [Icmadophila ericetorum]